MAGEPPEKVQEGFSLLNCNDDQPNGLCEEDENSRRDVEGNCVTNKETKFEFKRYDISATECWDNGRRKHINKLCCLKPD